MVLKPFGISPRKYQHEAIPVGSKLGEPIAGFGAVGWIAPDESMPRSKQTVIFDGVVIGRRCPGAFHWRARVEVERAERVYDGRRSQPLFLAVFEIPVVPEVAEFGFVTADDVGVTRDFPNE